MTRRVPEKNCTKKVCVDFLAPTIKWSVKVVADKRQTDPICHGSGKVAQESEISFSSFGAMTCCIRPHYSELQLSGPCNGLLLRMLIAVNASKRGSH